MQLVNRIKKFIRILFVYDEEARIDLFDAIPAIKRFYQNRRNLRLVRIFGDITFSLIILMGLFGPHDPSRNVSLFLAWGIWWVSIVLSWFFLGKSWCGICPFPGVGRIFQSLGLSLRREPPAFLAKYRNQLALALFAFIIWVESITNMKTWPLGTALLLLGILFGATVMGFLYNGQSWCRYLCPMGRMIGAAATLSMIELRPDLNKCKTCRTFACKKGVGGSTGCPVYLGAFNIRNNIDCLMCGHCVALCDKDGPRLQLRNPFVELIINKGRNITCSYIIPFLMGSQLARFFQRSSEFAVLKSWLLQSNAIAFTLLLAMGFGCIFLAIRIGAHLFRGTDDPLFGRFSPMIPVFVPLAFTGELAYRLDYFLAHLGDVLPTLGRQFGFHLEHAHFTISSATIYWICQILLGIGGVSCSYVLHLLTTRDFEGLIPKENYLALHLLVVVVFFFYLILF